MGILSWFAAGAAVTPLLEHVWHARVAHGRLPHPSRELHLEHHRTANTVVDPWVEMRDNARHVGLALLGVNVVLAPFLGLRRTVPLSVGLLGGYMFSTLYHAQMHERAPRSRYERWMWRFHWHHHASDAKKNFGLTNPVFDFVFRTAVVPTTVEVPEKLAPPWMRRGTHEGFRIRPSEHAAA